MDKSCDSELLRIEGSACSMDVDEAIKEVSKIGLVLKETQYNAIKSFAKETIPLYLCLRGMENQ